MIKNKFESHKMNDETKLYSEVIRHKASSLDDILDELPNSIEKTLSMTKLEECVMWANKALALHGMESKVLKQWKPKSEVEE